MKSTILLFSGSNSSVSINQQLIRYTATLLTDVKAKVIDLRDFEPPMFDVDLEKAIGIPGQIKQLLKEFEQADAIVISTPEHNGLPPAFFKSVLDWLSRVHLHLDPDRKFLENKPVLLMSASPGRGGAMRSREAVKGLLILGKANIVGEFSLPSFNHTFANESISDDDLKQELVEQLNKLKEVINENVTH